MAEVILSGVSKRFGAVPADKSAGHDDTTVLSARTSANPTSVTAAPSDCASAISRTSPLGARVTNASAASGTSV